VGDRGKNTQGLFQRGEEGWPKKAPVCKPKRGGPPHHGIWGKKELNLPGGSTQRGLGPKKNFRFREPQVDRKRGLCRDKPLPLIGKTYRNWEPQKV